MKKIILTLLLFVCIVIYSFAQQTDDYYNRAYNEIADMLDGKIPLSIKRAVFLTEWAYFDGNLDYNSYSAQIESTAKAIKHFYMVNSLNRFKTGLNVALFEYFTKPYSMNGNKPFTYDYEDFAGHEDFSKLFVTKVMRTHSGQCHSLPLYYKVLAEAIGAEAHFTFAPQHSFIRHRDEQDLSKWINVELTTQSLGREIFYIESFGITADAIRNKVYLYPLTDKETVAFLMSLLINGYHRKFKKWDDFVMRCAEKSLVYYPQNPHALQMKANVLNERLAAYVKSNNGKLDNHAKELDKQWLELDKKIKNSGWRKTMPDDKYEETLKNIAESMQKEGFDTQTIEKEMNRQRLIDKKPKPNINKLKNTKQ